MYSTVERSKIKINVACAHYDNFCYISNVNVKNKKKTLNLQLVYEGYYNNLAISSIIQFIDIYMMK